jgi:tripeptide aminopeptidase
MRYWLEHDMRPVEEAVRAMRQVGVEPSFAPIRSGTDGSKLTEHGLLTPNLSAGMQNVHDPPEWISLEDMARAVAVCVELAQEWACTE